MSHFNSTVAQDRSLGDSPHRTLDYIYSDNYFGGFSLFKEALKKESKAPWAESREKSSGISIQSDMSRCAQNNRIPSHKAL